MWWYVGRRLIASIPVFIGATLLIYAMVFLLPGDPVAALFGDRPANPATVAALTAQYNLDKPFIVQYLLYLKGVLTLDFGTNFAQRPVIDLMAQAFPTTIKLALMTLAFEAVLGIVVGVIAGLRRGGVFDSTVLILSLVVIAIPVFVLGFVLQFLFGIKLGWVEPTVGADATFAKLILPAIVLGSLSLAYVIRLTRQSISDNLNADFVRTARAKGISNRRVISVHVLRNSMIPVVTFLGADLGSLMAGAIVTEGIFNIQGIGRLLYDSIRRGESTVVVSVVTALVLVYVISNLIVDLLYAALDPRIRYV
ncbi:ABC transporter permease [Nakamurella deserti]|uniref:ABC transporter permease n=1 Tax=Nakamurella deserti TaxID=2164074 RepID=UPI000DBE8648|nr:ABC transporter permease [Nakamurella deserti]